MTKIKTVIGKEINISLLKGVKYSDFKRQNDISKIVAKEFIKSKNKRTIKKCIICGNKKSKLISTVMKIPFMQCKRCTHVYNKYDYDYYVFQFLSFNKLVSL